MKKRGEATPPCSLSPFSRRDGLLPDKLEGLGLDAHRKRRKWRGGKGADPNMPRRRHVGAETHWDRIVGLDSDAGAGLLRASPPTASL